MKFKATRNHVLLKQIPLEEKTKGGLYLPDQKEFKADPRGTVVAIGPTVDGVAVGDIVWFGTYAGTEVTLDGDKCLMLLDTDIVAVEV